MVLTAGSQPWRILNGAFGCWDSLGAGFSAPPMSGFRRSPLCIRLTDCISRGKDILARALGSPLSSAKAPPETDIPVSMPATNIPGLRIPHNCLSREKAHYTI
jgi:hypothetical protein